jgi:peptidoglycan-N-acetylglucosamine deacetylase
MTDAAAPPSGVWPGGARAAVTLTFDFDAETVWLSRDPHVTDRPGVLSQGRYGSTIGVPRILQLLAAEQLRATFFIPGWVAEHHPDQAKAIRDAGHEIGHHGYLHERATAGDPEGERTAFRKGLEALHKVLAVRPLGYRSPGWDLTPITLDLVREAGMLYSSNLMDDEYPYIHPDSGIVELPVQWSRDDAPYFLFNPHYVNRPMASPTLVLSEWQEELLGVAEWGGLFNLTMHPQIIGHPARLRMLKRLIAVIKGLDNVWVTTCEEVARYWRERSRAGALPEGLVQHERASNGGVQ